MKYSMLSGSNENRNKKVHAFFIIIPYLKCRFSTEYKSPIARNWISKVSNNGLLRASNCAQRRQCFHGALRFGRA